MSCNMPDFSVKEANLDTSESPVAGKRKSSSASGSSRRGKRDAWELTLPLILFLKTTNLALLKT